MGRNAKGKEDREGGVIGTFPACLDMPCFEVHVGVRI